MLIINQTWYQQILNAVYDIETEDMHTEANAERDIGEKVHLCPICGSILVCRANRWDGYFVSCIDFPKCRYLRHNWIDPEEAEAI